MRKILSIIMLLTSIVNFSQSVTKKTGAKKKYKKEIVYKNLTSNEYRKLIASDKKTLVDFNAKWCGPCKKIAPYIEKIKKEMNGELIVIKIDTDKNADLTQELKVTGLPTLILYEKGIEKWEHLGYIKEEELRQKIKN